MIESVRNHVIDSLESRYANHKPSELNGTPAYSEQFFHDWRENGLFHAFNGLKTFVLGYNAHISPLQATLYSAQTLARSAVLATGLTEYAETVKAVMNENDLSLQQKFCLGFYYGTVGYFMSARRYINDPEETEENQTASDQTYIQDRDPDENKPIWGLVVDDSGARAIKNAGKMTLAQAEYANKKNQGYPW